MNLLPSKSQRYSSFEDIFFAHYAQLSEWAHQLTSHNAAEANELIQELFIQFATIERNTDDIEQAQNYLFLALRNLHYARRRRASKRDARHVSLTEFDTATNGLTSADRHALIFVHAELAQICTFLCDRKNTSRSASIMVLRYLLGYFPSEIMKVAKASRMAVDKAIQAARRETRLHLERSSADHGPQSAAGYLRVDSRHAEDPAAILGEIRKRVFESRFGDCHAHQLDDSKYADPNSVVSNDDLAHLVSCARCLDKVNRLLGLPLLSERSPDDFVGRDNGSGPDDQAGKRPRLVASSGRRKKGDSEKLRQRLRRSAQEVKEHRPQSLLIAVDGDIRASQKIGAEMSELLLTLGRAEEPRMIEILSERGVCLAAAIPTAPESDKQLHRLKRISFSDDRWMELKISFAEESLTVTLVYHDPLGGLSLERELEVAPIPMALPAVPQKRAPLFSLFHHASLDRPQSKFQGLRTPRLNLLFISAVVFGSASALCFFFWASHPAISGDTLLKRAVLAEKQTLPASGVIYQKVRIKTPERIFERVIYRDALNKRRPRPGKLTTSEQLLCDRLTAADVGWADPLSAADFLQWHDRSASVHDKVTRAGNQFLTVTSDASPGSAVIQESLTIREVDFHPVGRTVNLRDIGVVEIAELNYDALPWGAINEDWFEPLSSAASPRPLNSSPSRAIKLPAPVTEAQLNEADLDVRLALRDLGADTSELISTQRQPSGLEVKGAVAGEQRKREIELRLAAIPHVLTSIVTFADLDKAQERVPSATSVGIISDTSRPSIMEDYLVLHGKDRESARSLGEKLLDASVTLNQEARAEADLQSTYKSTGGLTTTAQAALTLLQQSHRRSIAAAVEAERSVLGQTGLSLPAASLPASDRAVPLAGEPSPPGVLKLAEDNLNLCKQLSRAATDHSVPVVDLLNQLSVSAASMEAVINPAAQRIASSAPAAHAPEHSQTPEQK